MNKKVRPEVVTRQEQWDDYSCYLLESILGELININKSICIVDVAKEPKVEKKPKKSTRGDTK